jgi:Mrp family chromosome partitioning ATPase
LVVVEAEMTARARVAGAVQMLEEAGGNILGVVLNKRRYVSPAGVYNRFVARGLVAREERRGAKR